MSRLLLVTFLLACSLSIFGQPSTHKIKWQNGNRKFIVYLPVNYEAGEELPLVINMHPYLGTGAGQMQYTRYNRLADTANCIVVYPYGIGGRWNIGPFFNISSPVDDVGFIDRLIDYMSLLYNIDSRRVYATGYSAGGFMSYKLACEITNRITAIAPVAASMHPDNYNNCNPDRPVPLMVFNSVSDPITIYNGFEGVTPIDDVVELWTNLNDCDDVPTETEVPNISQSDGSTASKFNYSNCDESEFIFYKFQNTGHTWPGARPTFILGNTNQDINATQETWSFFRRHAIPEGLVCDKPTDLDFSIDNDEATFSWNAIDGIEYYSIFIVYPNGAIEYISDISTNSITLNSLEEGNLIWAVRAECESGHVDWSKAQFDEVTLRVAENEKAIKVFPNPTESVLNLEVEADVLNQNFQITNNFGKIVFHGKLESSTTIIDVSFLKEGIYYLKMDYTNLYQPIIKL